MVFTLCKKYGIWFTDIQYFEYQVNFLEWVIHFRWSWQRLKSVMGPCSQHRKSQRVEAQGSSCLMKNSSRTVRFKISVHTDCFSPKKPSRPSPIPPPITDFENFEYIIKRKWEYIICFKITIYDYCLINPFMSGGTKSHT